VHVYLSTSHSTANCSFPGLKAPVSTLAGSFSPSPAGVYFHLAETVRSETPGSETVDKSETTVSRETAVLHTWHLPSGGPAVRLWAYALQTPTTAAATGSGTQVSTSFMLLRLIKCSDDCLYVACVNITLP
jgi:hypothetical protein